MLIYLIGKNKEIEDVIENINFSSANIWERKHLENWICQYPEMLGEKLLIVTSEYDKFDKVNDRLDILAIDEKGKLVVIELKRDIADKFVDLQAIHYASYCSTLNLEKTIDLIKDYRKKNNIEIKEDVKDEIMEFVQNEDFTDFDNRPRVILVSNEFRERTLSSVLWLRDFEVDITCIRLECYKIANKIVIKPDVIIPQPEVKNFIVSVEKKRKEINALSVRQKEFYEFWTKILNEFKNKMPNITNKGPTKDSWLSIPVGFSNVHFEWTIRSRHPPTGFRIALHFEYPKYEKNKKLYDYFYTKKEELEKELGIDIIFQERWGKKWSQFFVLNENTSFDDENVNWGVDMMIKFYTIFKPLLDEYFGR